MLVAIPPLEAILEEIFDRVEGEARSNVRECVHYLLAGLNAVLLLDVAPQVAVVGVGPLAPLLPRLPGHSAVDVRHIGKLVVSDPTEELLVVSDGLLRVGYGLSRPVRRIALFVELHGELRLVPLLGGLDELKLAFFVAQC